MHDVLIVGAGPAGSVAATLLARAGVRVWLVDRATFPREKLCGDTINPGTFGLLRQLGMAAGIESRAIRVDGMRVTGEAGVAIEARYPVGIAGRALRRADLDWLLLEEAVAAGARFDSNIVVRRPIVADEGGPRAVVGVVADIGGRRETIRAPVIIAADGRRSTLAFALRLARHPVRPRRWAVGAYFESPIPSPPLLGEMHIRRGRYIGVAPIPGGLINVCLVKPAAGGDCEFRDPQALFEREIGADPMLRERFAGRKPVSTPALLGPLAVDVDAANIDGLILAGDAAGFVDPMTGDGLRFAVSGGALAAAATIEALERGWKGVHERLHAQRRREFGAKWRFNRALRALVASASAVRAAEVGARVAPFLVRALVTRAADCDIAPFAFQDLSIRGK